MVSICKPSLGFTTRFSRARRSSIRRGRASFGLCLLLAIGTLAGCDIEIDSLAETPDGAPSPQTAPNSQPAATQPQAVSGDSILIASYNIQVFGQSKLKNDTAMDVLAQVVRRFDVVAIQEIRSVEQNVMPEFVQRINADGSRYAYVIGPRQGRTNSKEQYAFVYDTTRLEVIDAGYIVPDPDDWLHREPMTSTFRVRGLPPEDAFTFTLVNIHTDPDDTDIELDALADVFRFVQQQNPAEDDVILLGDLNVDDRHLGELGRIPGIAWVISGQTTNTRGTKSYDNLLFDRNHSIEFLGRGGVFNVTEEYRLQPDESLKVSDHLPIWAEFDARESRGIRVAEQPGSTR